MPKFYRKSTDDKTVYKDPEYTSPIKDEAELRKLGGVPDWGPDASKTNIHTGGLKGTLVHTLPSGDDKKFLPSGKIDQMTLLRMSLKTASETAIKRGMRSGMETVTGRLEEQAGFAPEKVAGGMMGRIIDFVEGQVAPPIEKEFETTKSILDSIEKQQENEVIRARENVNALVETGAIMKMDDQDLEEMAIATDIPYENLIAIKKTFQANEAAEKLRESREMAFELYKEELNKVKDSDDLEAIKAKTQELSTAAQKIGQAMYQQDQQQAAGAEGSADQPQAEAKEGEDVVEGEVEDVKEGKEDKKEDEKEEEK